SFDVNGFRVSGITERSTGGTLSERRLYTATPQIAWKFSEWWKLELSYAYRLTNGETIPEVMSNATMFMLTYYPPKLSFFD
ncbi:MAG: hypothetical protein ABI604_05705, partial [Nitrospirota bacterium]